MQKQIGMQVVSMTKITLINALTLSRIPLPLMLCTMILFYDYPLLPCAVLFLIIGASDYFDGKFARKYHVQTDIGAKNVHPCFCLIL